MNERLCRRILVLTILICPIFSQKVIHSSLIFVIDTTNSMIADKKNVLNSTDGLFDAVLNSKKSEIENFVLVTFSDPGFELRIITDKRDEFKTALKSITLSGGGDCPEMAMSGIELGLKKGRQYSYLFVFTDATAKDINKFERVRNLALDLNTKIFFLVTEWSCQENTDFSAYKKLAHETGGEFFFMKKDNIPEIMKYVMKLVDSRKVDIIQKQFNATDDKKFVVPLDPSIGEAIMSVSSENSSLNVKDKYNTTVDTEEIAKIQNIKVVSWNNTNPGDYTVEINSTTNTLVTIHGTTKVTFNYGFSVTKPNYFNETTNRPVADQKSYILIKLNTEGEKLNLQRLQVVNLKDNILLDKVKFVAQEDHYYLTEPINFPKDTFKIVMIAEDEKTKDVLKRASSPIESQKVLPGTMKNEAPAVTIFGEKKVTTSTGNPLQLKCRVTGYPKPKISWEDAFGTTLTSTVSTVREEYEYLNVLNIDKVHQSSTYICKASNIISSDEKIVEVDTGDRFAVVKFSKDKKIEYNKEEKLFCKVNAVPPANVFWYLNGNQVEANDDFDISPDKSTLTIKKMKPDYIGTVLCEVRNSVKRLMYNMKLSMTGAGAVGPEIDKKTTEIFVVEGSSAIVSCRVLKGNPKPMINWTFKSKNNDTFYDIKEYNEDIRIEKVSTNEVGTYKCVAKNDISEDSHILDLTIEYAPVVLGQSNIDINQQIGQKILISCDIKGEPAPFISWFLNGLMIVESKLYQIDKDNTLTFEASIKTMGQYSCEGVNKFGSIKKIANVSVFEPLKIDSGETTNINIEVGRQLSLSCPVKGYPKPKIQWTFMPLHVLELRNLSSSNAQLQIPEVKTSDSGSYFCTVTISGDKKKHTFFVIVEEPIKSTAKKIVAVDGDQFLKIPCESAAEPKSTISWFKNGAPITVGNEWQTLESDGSLIIKEIKTPTAGIYDCANHDRSKVYESYEVKVAMHPDANNLNYTIEYFIENTNGTVPCKVAQAPTDDIRWYKKSTIDNLNNEKKIRVPVAGLNCFNCDIKDLVNLNKKVIEFGKNINFNPYKSFRHEGKYVCRANNGIKSKNDGVYVRTGSIPKFSYSNERLIENLLFDQGPYLNCAHSGKPKTEVLWWKNDIRMSFPDMTYSVKRKVTNKGKYKCVAKNIFGNISRQFYVIADDCLLNVETDFDRYHPLILTERYELPDFYIKDEHLAIPINTKVLFFCEGGFNKFNDQSVKATCREGKTFEINREIVDYTKLKCKKALQPVTIQEDNCASGKGNLFRIGISVLFLKNFIEVYRICVDKRFRFLYTEHKIRPWAANVSATGMQIEKWLHSDVLYYNNNEMYDCKRQRQKDAISAILGRALPGNDDECYVARQLINEKDVPPGFPQLLTHSYLNVIPHWNSTATKYWNILEEIIRDQTKNRIVKRTVTVITGVNYDVPAGEPQITITDKAGNSNKVPTFLWKVITDSMTASSVAIVQVNAPALLIGEKIKKYKVCDSKCNQINWLSVIDEEYIKSGFMLCCDIVTFEEIFTYKELFNKGYRKLLTSFEN